MLRPVNAARACVKQLLRDLRVICMKEMKAADPAGAAEVRWRGAAHQLRLYTMIHQGT